MNSFGDTLRRGQNQRDWHSLLRSEKLQEAIEMFKINARLSLQVSGAFVSLGEVYAAARQNDLAIENYEKAL